MLKRFALLLVVALPALAWEPHTVLDEDNECGNQGNDCALSQVQLRKPERISARSFRPVPSDCKSFGCGSEVVKDRSCQCNSGCVESGNCCADYAATCGKHGPHPKSMSMLPYASGGVNFGGLFVLEDWFFSGSSGSHVATIGSQGQGVCLPPLLGKTTAPWASEGILVKGLVNSEGPAEAVKIIEAHRASFITEQDFSQAAQMGIRKIRLPIPWYAFADALAPLDADAFAPGAKIVPDPYYASEASFVTLDRKRLVEFLQTASSHNIKVILDMHNHPGGAQLGTYNGIYPLKPQFWLGSSRVGKKPVRLTELGLWIAKAFIQWVEQLEPQEFAALDGLTLMNEPAHRANGQDFIESEQAVLDWLAKSSNLFRASSLPSKGKKLYVSLVETTWKDPYNLMPAWFTKTFASHERHAWAVFDVHWYISWSGDLCSGRVNPGGRFTCDMSVEELRPLLRNCAVHDMVRFFKKVDGLKACSEWSLGTFEQPQQSCQSPTLLTAFLEEQLDVYKMYDIEPFFWTWTMPYARNFQSGWSLKSIAGLEDKGAANATCE